MFLLFREFEGEPPNNLALNAEEIRHIKARRLAPGAPLFFGDGRGRRWAGFFQPKGRWERDRSTAVEERDEPERVLCTALPEGRRWDWLLQKATELGVTRIQPVNFRRSVRREINAERALSVMIEAAGQSRRFLLPEIEQPLKLAALIEGLRESGPTYLLHYDEERGPGTESTSDWMNDAETRKRATMIVGPEGGFEVEELEQMRQMPGLREVQLGTNVLRIETAGLAMLARLLTIG